MDYVEGMKKGGKDVSRSLFPLETEKRLALIAINVYRRKGKTDPVDVSASIRYQVAPAA